MSSISVFGLASAIFVSGFVATYWLTGKMNDASVEVFTGVIKGFAIPLKNRWIWLWQVYVVLGTGVSIFMGVLALAEFQLAKLTPDESLRGVVQVYAFVFAVGALALLLMGVISGTIALVSELRKAERP